MATHPTSMLRARLWKMVGVILSVAAAGSLATGLAYGYFTAHGSGIGSATVGSVALTVNTPATHSCTYSNINPGDTLTSQTCVLDVSYAGTGTAWVSLTVGISSKAGSGGTSLFDGTTNGIRFAVSDGHNSFTVPSGTGTTGGSCATGFTCWTSSFDLGAWYTGSSPTLAFSPGSRTVWTLTPTFLSTVLNPYQGGTATVTLTANAVQSEGNSLNPACTTSTIGQPCPAAGSFSWS